VTLTFFASLPAAALVSAAPPLWLIAGWMLAGSLAVATAVSAWVSQRGRRAVLSRLAVRPRQISLRALGGEADAFSADGTPEWQRSLAVTLVKFVPAGMRDDAVVARLAQAGFHSPSAPVLFGAARLAAPVLAPLLVVAATGGASPLGLALGVLVGAVAPTALLDRRAGARHAALTTAIPDALDLLIVCLEAGVGIDAALVRVARELAPTHPVLAAELEDVAGRTGAGIPREEALRALVTRTGVEDLRAIVSTMVQAERLGTSLARVLRIHGEALRTRRRQNAEKKAAEASVKMIIPLVACMLPAFFIIVLGPAAIGYLTSGQ
jgi:tight adherence protein C